MFGKVVKLLLVWLVLSFGRLSAETLKVGLLTDLSGFASYYGQQSRIGALLALEELKSSDQRLQLIIEDSALSTKQALSAAHKLIFVDEVAAVYVDFGTIAAAVSPLLLQNNAVMIYSSAIESVLDSNPLAFSTYLNYFDGCNLLTDLFLKRGFKKIAVLKAEAEYAELCLSGAKKAAKIYQESFQVGESVVTQILRFKNRGIEAIINASYHGDVSNMLKAASDLKYPVKFGFPQDNLTKETEQKFREALGGSLTFGLRHPSQHLIGRAKAIQGEQQLEGYESMALTYVHIKQLGKALMACGNDSPSCLKKEILVSPPDPELGFKGWDEKQKAKLEIVLKEHSKGKLSELERKTLQDSGRTNVN